MLLSARLLGNVSSVNSFSHEDTIRFTEGDTVTVYFQLIDLALDKSSDGFVPAGRRYMPEVGATMEITLGFIDDAKTIVRAATQPYPTRDPSVWALSLFATDSVRGTVDMRLKLTEGSKVTRGVIRQALSVEPQVSAY